MLPRFDHNDPALMKVMWGLAAVNKAADLLDKLALRYNGQRALPHSVPITLPHTIYYGPGGTGKTKRAEYIATALGCTDENGKLIRLNAECISSGEDLASVLEKSLSWEGYLCSSGKISHAACMDSQGQRTCSIIDPINVRGPVQYSVVFIDEIHVLPKAVQEQLGLILLDFRYQFKEKNGNVRNIYFPKFTCIAATTALGDILTPLQTRFGNQVEVPYYTDEQMYDIITEMATQKGWKIENEAIEIIAKCSQGVARQGENHLRGLYEASCYYGSKSNSTATIYLPTLLALKYIQVAKYLPDGMRYSQIKILQFLKERGRTIKTDQWKFLGEQAICDGLGIDKEHYRKQLEPRLLLKGYIERGGRGRSLTDKGLLYLLEVEKEYKNNLEDSYGNQLLRTS